MYIQRKLRIGRFVSTNYETQYLSGVALQQQYTNNLTKTLFITKHNVAGLIARISRLVVPHFFSDSPAYRCRLTFKCPQRYQSGAFRSGDLGSQVRASSSVGDVIAKHSLQHIHGFIGCVGSCSFLLKPQLVTLA